jgi:formylglycine-generating enzyme required for sulfatase activity
MSVQVGPKLCFVLIPMRNEFEELYQEVIKPTVANLGLDCVYADEIFGTRPIIEDVWEYCERARVVIAELTGCNPNVFYEVGYSHAFDREKVILITQNVQEVSFDLRTFRCIVYSTLPRRIRELQRRLESSIQGVLDRGPESPRVITRIVKYPASPGHRLREALEVYRIVETIERGQPLVADKRITRLLNLPKQARIVQLEDYPPTVALAGIEFILIPPGEFTIGSEEQDPDETRSHDMHLEAFYIGRYPVTNAQYKRFVDATGYETPRHWAHDSIPRGYENHPVVWVNWHDARSYCQWLSYETRRAVRLPTEAHWEKAARGTDSREYPWGHGFDVAKCNTVESGIWATTAVGEYSPQGDSAYGVADMAGNVWEWTSSLRWDYPYDRDDGREDPEADGTRVLRGGRFYDSAAYARVPYRYAAGPDAFSPYTGLRVVVAPLWSNGG